MNKVRLHQRPAGVRPSFIKALAASVGLSLLFIVVYCACNWITSQRHDVGTLSFQWERFIPFVPWLLPAYLSIDFFFVVAPFLCRNERELTILCQRIIVALVVAGMCFLLFPLRFSFERPHASGWLGAVFDWFRGIDLPYNLVPSLHLAFLTILTEHYARHTRGLWRFVLTVWFLLVGLSTLLTYQHHVIDVITGIALGVYCIYFIRQSVPLPVIPNVRVASYYVGGAGVLGCLILGLWPWGVLLLWPAISLVLVAIAYLRTGPAIFLKRKGELHWSARLVLAPYLLGQQFSLRYYQRQCRAWDAITSSVWIGRTLNKREAIAASSLGVTAVLDLTAEFSETVPFRHLSYRNIPILDLTAPTSDQLQEMVEFIEAESRKGIIYCHCKIGYSRTAAATAAYLIKTGMATNVKEALAFLRKVRPTIIVRPEIISSLSQFSRNLPQKAEEIAKPVFSSPAMPAPP